MPTRQKIKLKIKGAGTSRSAGNATSKTKALKRINNIYQDICSIDNLRLAAHKAQKRKKRQPGVIAFNQDPETYLFELQKMLINKTYRTSEYTTFPIYEPKERLVYRLPFFPDRIAHHAVMNRLEGIFTAMFTADTYSCIKGRGIHAAAKNLRKALLDVPGTQYCLKLDIKKFYPSVDPEILKKLLRRKFKDKDLLWLLDEVIDSATGLPIGNYLSQYFANFYLTGFDHWLKQDMRVKYYFRYADDIVILCDSKEALHHLRVRISAYLQEELNLELKDNYQVFPVASRGIDFLGCVFFHTHTFLRKSIKQNIFRMLARKPDPKSIASYHGWLLLTNSINLRKKFNHEEFQRLWDRAA